jgi:hypothetical protein
MAVPVEPPIFTYPILSGRRCAKSTTSPDPLISLKSVCAVSGLATGTNPLVRRTLRVGELEGLR